MKSIDEERLAEIDRQLEALGQPETPVEVLMADMSALALEEVDAILGELAEGRDLDIELAPLPELPELDELPRGTTSVSEPPTIGQSANATEEFPALALDEEDEFDLPPPSVAPQQEQEDLLGSGLEDLGTSDVPEPLSASFAAWIDPPDSDAPPSMPPDPRIPDLGGFDDEEEEERTGLFSQEDIDAIRASSPPPPRSAPPPASRSLVPSVPPPVPGKRPPPASAPPPPIPMSVTPSASVEEDLEILDGDDFELMIEEDAIDDDSADAGLDDLIESGFEDSTAADEDEPVIREPEVAEPAEAEAEVEEPGEDEGEGEGEKKGFFKKLFG